MADVTVTAGVPGAVTVTAGAPASVTVQATTAATVTVQAGGTTGPQGPPGAPAYVHTQETPAVEWVINHNLGYSPAVELRTVGGAEFDAEVVHASDNQARVYLTTPTAGTARLI